jgi:small ligand-binding sensory domain FIST
LSIRAEILHGILKKIVLGLEGKIPSKMLRKLIFSLMPKKRPKIPHFGSLKTAIT